MLSTKLPPISRIASPIIRVVLVDPHCLTRNGIKTMLEQEPDLQIVGCVANGEDAISTLRNSERTREGQVLRPDVVLIDSFNEFTAIQKILKQSPTTKILVLSTHDREDVILQAMQAGAQGYLLKDMPSEDLANAIRWVHQGYTQFSPGLFDKLMARFPTAYDAREIATAIAALTSREQEVLRLIRKGITNREIAQQLCISEGTVKSYVTSLLSRLSLRNRAQLAIYANSISWD